MSARKPLTVNEALAKLKLMKLAGKGEHIIVTDCDWRTEEEQELMTLHGFEELTAFFENLAPTYPKNQTQTHYGVRVDGRGKPKDSQRVVRIF